MHTYDAVDRPFPIHWWIMIFPAILLALLVVVIVGLAWGAEVPPNATLLQTVPLPCAGGQYQLYDTDGDPSNGAEFVTVEADGRRVAILQFSPGHNGGFVAAVVQIPSQPEQVFASAEALSARYSHPCEIVTASGART